MPFVQQQLSESRGAFSVTNSVTWTKIVDIKKYTRSSLFIHSFAGNLYNSRRGGLLRLREGQPEWDLVGV